MKIRILLVVLLMFFVNVISVNARETILICSDNFVSKKVLKCFLIIKSQDSLLITILMELNNAYIQKITIYDIACFYY